DLKRPVVRGADDEVPAVAAFVLEELEGVGAAVADVDPVAAGRRRADLLGGLDPQQALAAEALAAGGHALARGLAGAAVQLLAGQAEPPAGGGVDRPGPLALPAPAAPA